MKKLLLILLLILPVTDKNDNVYICTGDFSKCYHKTDKCEGLIYCGKEIKQVTLEQAKKMNRKPCKYCYKPTK